MLTLYLYDGKEFLPVRSSFLSKPWLFPHPTNAKKE